MDIIGLVTVVAYVAVGFIFTRYLARHQRMRHREPRWLLLLHDTLLTVMWPVFAAMGLVALLVLAPIYVVCWIMNQDK